MNPRIKAYLQKNITLILGLVVVCLSALLVYRNTFHVPFLFDDITQIVFNPKIQSLHGPWHFLFNNRRPVLYASLAFNVYQGGLNTFGFHVFNLSVHILTAISLFFLIIKTCRLPSVGENFRRDRVLLAFGACLLWVCHPLQTQAVTYIIQRAESLMALFFVITLYFSAKHFTTRKILWLVSAGISALFCGLTKEVALALPIVVLLYDRAFISPSFGKALVDHRWLYASLGFTWAVMIFLYMTTRPEQTLTAGFGIKGITPLEYALNQPQVILHYLQLALWPNRLVFDYQWPAVNDISILAPSLLVIVTALIILACSYRRYPAISFLGMSFFVILAPSSSFIPLKDLIYEYRMYLPLSCLTVIFSSAMKIIIDRYVNPKSRSVFFVILIGILALILGGVTYQRNKVYQSEEKLWRDVLSKQPDNVRIWNDLGSDLFAKGRDKEAAECFLKSLTLNPNSPEIASNLAMALAGQKKFNEALFYAQKAVELSPEFAVGYHNWGVVYSQMGEYQRAIDCYQKAMMLGFIKPAVLKNLAVAFANTQRLQEAVNLLKEAQRLDPQSQEIDAILKKILKNMSINRK